MIKLELRQDSMYGGMYSLRSFRCPSCNSRDSFTGNTISPFRCWNCGDKYPEISLMMRFQVDREEYYKNKH